jgi:Cu-Zn family superoxide dismutase
MMPTSSLSPGIAMRQSLRLAVGLALVAGCSQPAVQTPAVVAAPAPAPRAPTRSAASFTTATATIRDAVGTQVGTATFADSYAGLIVSGSVQGLGIGAHGVHIHETGKCDPPFATAGGHFNPEKHKHGFKSAEGWHLGDLPNIDVPPSGTLKFEFLLPDVSLKGAHALLDADGASIVVHATRDDFTTDPAGNSGTRLACGVITAG